MSLRAISRSVRFLTIVQERSIRPVFTTAGLTGRGKPSWNSQNKECIERTQIILRDRLRLDNLFIAPTFNKNIRELFNFFPLTPDKVESILLDHPDIVNHEAEKVIEYIKVLVGKSRDIPTYGMLRVKLILRCRGLRHHHPGGGSALPCQMSRTVEGEDWEVEGEAQQYIRPERCVRHSLEHGDSLLPLQSLDEPQPQRLHSGESDQIFRRRTNKRRHW